MRDIADRTLIWGGERVFHAGTKRLEVLSSYSIFVLVAAAISWLPTSFVIGVLGAGDALILGVFWAFVFALALALLLYLTSSITASLGLDMSPLPDGERILVENLVEGICAQIGLTPPRIYELQIASITAISLSAGRRSGIVVISKGAVASLNRMELEALLSRQLAILRSGRLRNDSALLAVRRVATVFSAGYFPNKITELQANDQELADLSAVTITRYPPGLVSLLQKALEQQEAVETGGVMSRSFAPLWLLPPSDMGSNEQVVRRIGLLNEW